MRKRITSLLLTLVMLLSLVPAMGVTAFAAAYNSVGVNNVVLKDGYYLETNGATEAKKGANTAPATYVAWYKNGVLTLKGYNGKDIVTQGVAAGELTVKLIGSNSINNGAIQNVNGGDITVTSDSSGTLSISKTTSGSNPAIGIETGLSGSYTTGNVTIKGSAKVTIKMTHNGTSGYEKAYGIFAKENITISENASVDITCATPNNTTGGGNCNGLYAAKDVIIDTNGTIKIDVTKAGKDDGYSFGVYPMGTATLTKVGEMEVQWKKHATHSSYPGGVVYKGASLSDTDYAINEDTTNCYASYRNGQPYEVMVVNGQLTGPGVKYANGSGKFLAGDPVNITPDPKAGKSGESIPFKKWTSKDVTLTSPTTENNSFSVPGKDVTVTAMHSPFVGTPTFTPIGTTSTEGTLTFTTKVTLYDGNESFALVKEAEVDDTTKYNSINPSTTSPSSPYEYSSTVNFNNFPEGNYYVAEKLNGAWYLSEKFTVNYTVPVTTYTVSFDANGGTGTMADVTGVTGSYTLPACTFTAPSDKQFKGWATSADGSVISGTTYEISSDTTFYAIWESKEYSITVTDGKATIGAGSEISKAAEGTAVTLTANAAPSGKVFDKWEVVSGGITLADATSASTTFTMPASAVSVKATYKNAPHTHTYNQETVKPEALKTPADCTSNAVYFKSCSCGAISTTDTFVAMNTALGHAHGSDWKYDSTNHWHECSRCHDKKDEAAHDYGSDNVCDTCGYDKTVPHTHNLTLVPAKAATCTNPGNSAYYTCDGCDKWFEDATGSVEITDKTSVKIPAPGHTAGTEWKSDDTNHWHECTVAGCGVIIESTKSAHTAGEWIVDTPATATTAGTKHKECTVCKKVLETATIPATHSHSYGTDWKYDDTNHWHECACGDKTDVAAHTASDWIIDTPATATTSGTKHKECTVCKRVLETGTIPATGGSEHSHSYGSEWKNDATNHWHECSCGDKADKAAHSFKWVVDKEATATKKGSKHQECKVCGYKKAAVEIPATGSTTKPSDPTQTNPSTGAESPKTGDNSNMILWIALLFVSGGVLTVLGLNGKKRKESEAE